MPEKNIIYLGDGETDVPAMKMVNYLGGNSIAVYDPNNKNGKDVCENLIEQKRAKYAHKADYSEGSELDITVKKIIKDVAGIK